MDVDIYPTSLSELKHLIESSSTTVLHRFGFQQQMPRIIRVMPGIVLKLGGSNLREEILCTQYAFDSLDVPIPCVLHPYRELPFPDAPDSELVHSLCRSYYALEEVPGVSLDKVVDSLSIEAKTSIASQLRAFLDQMRSLTSSTLGSVSGGPYALLEGVHESVDLPKRAFSSVAEFKDYFRALLVKCDHAPPDMIAKTMATMPDDSPIHFTHGDLLPKNIMVEVQADGADARITGIIDWAYAGFYPAFWEQAIMLIPDWWSPGWTDILGMLFPGDRLPLVEQGCAISYLFHTLEHWL
ncbi:hypothetical protein CVT26_010201 [Gymnopilus dilepis]|uniref:Aminoglycoside phosphotransferase domain-containing protein n=1 Tax=Gymnopilus dilepis TaxID=231916 RepID=A0A409W4M6_9AGAR|nr:hypothetical protein CVT26_010201 [Gymnopilus dilepis]